jgi:hypothetical protein
MSDQFNSFLIIAIIEGITLWATLVLRKASKFLVGTSEDAVIPIPVVIDVKTGKILTELLPKELREEYEEYNKTK